MIDIQRLAYRGALALYRPDRAPHLSILMFHRVLPTRDEMRPLETTAEEFEWQMRILSRHFNVLRLVDAVDMLRTASLPPRAACVTFDDGYADNAAIAQPIMAKYGIPATVFVASGHLDGGRMWNDTIVESLRIIGEGELDLGEFGLGVLPIGDTGTRVKCAYSIIRASKYLGDARRREIAEYVASKAGELPDNLMLTSARLRDLSAAGVDIGGHTVSHPILAGLPIEQAREEIQGGRAALAGILGQPPRIFAYPNGRRDQDYNDEHIQLVKEAGFEAAVVTNVGVAGEGTDLYQLPRFTPWDKSELRYMVRMAWNARRLVKHTIA